MKDLWKLVLFSSLLLLGTGANAATLTVGEDKTFSTLAAAVKASHAGDTILIDAGTYRNDFVITRHALTIKSTGGAARFVMDRPIPNGKGFIVSNADLHVKGLIFEGAHVPDKNGAGIRYQGGDLLVEECIFSGNEDGILGGSVAKGSVTIRDSVFEDNGHGDGYSHGIYIGMTKELLIEDSIFRRSKIGHHIKSRAFKTTITNSLLDDGDVPSSYSIDLPNGGKALIEGNRLIQSSNAENRIFINIGNRKVHSGTRVVISNNDFVNHANKGVGVQNRAKPKVVVEGNRFSGPIVIVKGNATTLKNVTDPDAP